MAAALRSVLVWPASLLRSLALPGARQPPAAGPAAHLLLHLQTGPAQVEAALPEHLGEALAQSGHDVPDFFGRADSIGARREIDGDQDRRPAVRPRLGRRDHPAPYPT